MVDVNFVKERAAELGFNVQVTAIGKFSARMTFVRREGKHLLCDDWVDVCASGDKYWIIVGDNNSTNLPEKWCMPRAEVANDRADKFLVEVLQNYEGSLDGAVAVLLGIGSIASRVHTKEVLKKRGAANVLS